MYKKSYILPKWKWLLTSTSRTVPSRLVQRVQTCLPWHGALHQLPAGPNLRLRGDLCVSEVNKLSLQRLRVIDGSAHAHTTPSTAPLFFFSSLVLFRPWIPMPLPHIFTPGEVEMHTSVVCRFPHPRPPVELSLLSANFTTCAKLKALMRKKSLPLPSPLLSSLLSFHSVVCNLDLVSFPSSHLIYSAHCFCVGVCWCVSVWEWVRESLFER